MIRFLRFSPLPRQVTLNVVNATYSIHTLGCKVNQYESQVLREVLESLGLRPAEAQQAPDWTVVNACAVTGAAMRKNRQTIRRAAARFRTSIVVVGCGASADRERLLRLPGVAVVWGHDVDASAELRRLILHGRGLDPPITADQDQRRLTEARTHDPGEKVWMIPSSVDRSRSIAMGRTVDSAREIISRSLPVVKSIHTLADRIESFEGHERAFLKVQDGCDAHCSYCIIPRLRPTLRSKPVEAAAEEAAALVRAGHKEIIITGIYLGSYGRDTAIRKRFVPAQSPLASLVKAIAQVPGLRRLRLSSLEPGDVDDSLLDVLSSNPVCVPHLHLPLQSGSADVLRRMNRQYTVKDFLATVDRVRTRLLSPAVSTDIIVGFPDETDADFEASLRVARYAEFLKVHAFPFSPREGTAAFRWKKHYVDPMKIRDRMTQLAELERELSLGFRRRFLGRMERVIVERRSPLGFASHDFGDIRSGRCDRYFEVHFHAESCDTGDIVDVRIDRVTPARTHGTVIPAGRRSYPLPVLPVFVA